MPLEYRLLPVSCGTHPETWSIAVVRILTLEIPYQLRVEFLTQTKECLLWLTETSVKHSTHLMTPMKWLPLPH